MASTEERLLGFVHKRIMTDDGWRYFCTECTEYHPYDAFYRAPGRPFGIFSTCGKTKQANRAKRTKKDPTLENIDTSHLKLNKVSQDHIEETIDLLKLLGYDTSGNVHEQFLKKHQYEKKQNLPKR
jgi:hypothetical protein